MMHLFKNQKQKRKFLWALVFILPIIIIALHKTGHEDAGATLIGTKIPKPIHKTDSSDKKDDSGKKNSVDYESNINKTANVDNKDNTDKTDSNNKPSTSNKLKSSAVNGATINSTETTKPKNKIDNPDKTALTTTEISQQPPLPAQQDQPKTQPQKNHEEPVTEADANDDSTHEEKVEEPSITTAPVIELETSTTLQETTQEEKAATEEYQTTPTQQQPSTTQQKEATKPIITPPDTDPSTDTAPSADTISSDTTPPITPDPIPVYHHEPDSTVVSQPTPEKNTSTPQVIKPKPQDEEPTHATVKSSPPMIPTEPEPEPKPLPPSIVQSTKQTNNVQPIQPDKPTSPQEKTKASVVKPIKQSTQADIVPPVPASPPPIKKEVIAPKIEKKAKQIIQPILAVKPKPIKKMIDPRFESLEVLASKKIPKRKIDIKHWQTDKGAQVYFVAAPEIPMLDIRLVFDAGSARDAFIPGLAYLMNGMLGEGTKALTSNQIAEQFESLGAQFSNSSYRDMAIASLRTLTDDQYLKPAIKLFTQVVTQANFPDDAITRVKNQIAANLQYIKQQPSKLAEQAFFASLYGNHPYSTPKEGTDKSITRIKKNHLQTFYQEYYVAKNLVISMVGDITQKKAQQIANTITQPMHSGGHAEPLVNPTKVTKLKNQIKFPSSQTHVYVGALGLKKGNPDYPAIFVGNHILGGSGFGSRLMENVREKEGLAYSVGSGFSLMRAPGPFIINLQTKAEQTDKALAIVNKTLTQFIKEGPSEKELSDAKQNILGSFPLRNATNSNIVGQLGSIGFYQLPLNYLDKFMEGIQQVTTADIKQAFAKYVDPENLLVITVGPK